MDYVDELLEQHFAGELELEELEESELEMVLDRLEEMAQLKILDGFDEKLLVGTVHLSSVSIH
jgi:hypothetical protein